MEQVIFRLSTKGFDASKDKKFTKAQDYFNMAIVSIMETKKSENELAHLRYNLGLAYLKDNVYSWGFSNYSYVIDCPYIKQREFYGLKERVVENTTLKDKRVLIYNLISIDYFILFCRYIPRFVELYQPKQIIIEVNHYVLPFISKISLFKQCIFVPCATMDMFDSYIEISTLPLFIGIRSSYETYNHLLPYIFPNNEIVGQQLKMLKPLLKKSKQTILLNWSINPIFERSNIDDMNINYIKEFTEKFPSIKFICAQTYLINPDINNIIVNKNIESYEQIISLVTIVDFTITTCSFLAHVAGAMGKKVLLLLDTEHEWLWYNTNWYQNVTIFKQRHHGDWFHVFEDLTCYLQNQII